MITTHARRTRRVVVAFLAALTLGLSVPTMALAQGVGPVGQEALGGGEGQGDRGAGGGGLAQTGFDAWKIGALGLVCIAGALVLIRGTAPARRSL